MKQHFSINIADELEMTKEGKLLLISVGLVLKASVPGCIFLERLLIKKVKLIENSSHLVLQREKENGTESGVAAGLQAAVTSTAVGAKTERAAAERRGAAAETGRAGTVAAPPGSTRNTGQVLSRPQGCSSNCLTHCRFKKQRLNEVLFGNFLHLAAHRGERERKKLANTGMCLLQALSTSHRCSTKLCKVPSSSVLVTLSLY